MQESVTQTVKDEVFQRLDALSEKIGVAAGQLWEVLVTQHAVVNGIFFSAVALVFLLVGVTGLVLFVRSLIAGDKKATESTDSWGKSCYRWHDGDITRTVLYGFVTVIGLVAGISMVLSNLPHLINPEYYALQDILKVF